MSIEKYQPVDLSCIADRRIACLSLDVEQDYGTLLRTPQYEGLKNIPILVKYLEDQSIPLTCFVQGSLFNTHSEKLNDFFELDVEIEPHSYSHPGPEDMDFDFEIRKSISAYKDFTGEAPLGYRSPDGYINGKAYYETLWTNGIKYDSSVFPSFRPGRFNHLNHPTKPYSVLSGKIIELPFSVLSPILRIPISLSYLKLFGWYFFQALQRMELPNLIIFDFHLHDLSRLSNFDHIFMQKKHSILHSWTFKDIYHTKGDQGFLVLQKFIDILNAKKYEYIKVKDIYQEIVQ